MDRLLRRLLAAVRLAVAAVALAPAVPDRVGRLRRLAATRRPAEARTRFHAAFADLPESFVRRVYLILQDLVGLKAFPVEATDHLWKTLELDTADVATILQLIYERSPRILDQPYAIADPIHTVRGFVVLAYSIARHGEPAAVLDMVRDETMPVRIDQRASPPYILSRLLLDLYLGRLTCIVVGAVAGSVLGTLALNVLFAEQYLSVVQISLAAIGAGIAGCVLGWVGWLHANRKVRDR